MAESNKEKRVPRGSIKFNIQLSEDQKIAKEHVLKHPFNFIMGRAGSGKTALAVQIALDLYFKREIEKIIITRPTVSKKEIGYLPGGLEDKMEPWLMPIMSNLYKVYNKPEKVNKMIDDKVIEIIPLSFFRGITVTNAVCIIDEFQNLDNSELVMCIGRLGKESTMIFTGDDHQIDLRDKSNSSIQNMNKILCSNYVYKTELQTNHRHEALEEIFRLLNS